MILIRRLVFLIVATLVFSVGGSAQWVENPRTGSSQGTLVDRTNMAGMSGMSPQLEVSLVDKNRNAAQKKAVVKAEVWGVHLVEPQSGKEPKLTEAYLMYRLDNGDIVRTADDEYGFTNVSPGYHSISVQLSSLDGQPVGARRVLSVHIPK